MRAIVAFDFFTVPTVAFRVLYCFFVIEHGRRHILHFNTTRHPSAEWAMQQLREAFPEAGPHRCVILDRDSILAGEVIAFLRATGLEVKRTSLRAPLAKWNRGTMDQELPRRHSRSRDRLERRNQRRLVRDYIGYHEEDRTHDSLDRDTSNRRPVEPKPADDATLTALPRLGKLHHRYSWR